MALRNADQIDEMYKEPSNLCPTVWLPERTAAPVQAAKSPLNINREALECKAAEALQFCKAQTLQKGDCRNSFRSLEMSN